MPLDNLKIKKVTLTCIYSFLPVYDGMNYDQLIIDCLIKSKHPTSKSGYGKPDIDASEEHPCNRTGLSSYLALNTHIGYEKLKTISTTLGKLNLTIYPLFRFYSHGCSMTFHIVAERKDKRYVSIEEAYELQKIVSSEKNNLSKITLDFGDNVPQTLFSYYMQEVNKKLIRTNDTFFEMLLKDEENPLPGHIQKQKEAIKRILSEKKYFLDLFHKKKIDHDSINIISNKECLININKLLTNVISNGDNGLDKSDLEDISKFIERHIVSLLCLKEQIVISPYLNIKEGDVYSTTIEQESHVPWMITCLELDQGKALNTFCSSFPGDSRVKANKKKLSQIAKFEKYIAPFIYRAVGHGYEELEIDPAHDSFQEFSKLNGFNNCYLDARLYIHMSRRSILTITRNNYKQPASYVLPTLFDLCELTHTRWQALIVLNMVLDKYVKVFSNHKIDKYTPSQKLQIIMIVIKKSLSNLENPTNYVVSGDSLREIHELLVNTYKLDKLDKMALRKSELLETIFDLSARQYSANYLN